MKPAALEYVAASTAEEALVALARYDGNARLLAGGQSLVPLLSMRLMRPTGAKCYQFGFVGSARLR